MSTLFSSYGLFINTLDTTNCTGNATAWNVCYYYNTTDSTSTTQFGVYRQVAGTSVYNLIPGSSANYTISRDTSQYICSTFSLPQTQQFLVQRGDAIVACTQSWFNGGRLGIVGIASGQSVLRANLQLTNLNPCGGSLQNSIDISSGFTTMIGFALHVNLGQQSDYAMS